MSRPSALGSFGTFAVVLCVAGGAAADRRSKDLARCQAMARACAEAVVGGHDARVVACTFPKVVEMSGGRQAMIEVLRTERAKTRAAGFGILAVTAHRPGQIVAAGKLELAIVPTEITMKSPDGKLQLKGFMLGVSPDRGKRWWFIDGSSALDAAMVKRLLPEAPATLRLPDKQLPIKL